jgi:hypothetical protein
VRLDLVGVGYSDIVELSTSISIDSSMGQSETLSMEGTTENRRLLTGLGVGPRSRFFRGVANPSGGGRKLLLRCCKEGRASTLRY